MALRRDWQFSDVAGENGGYSFFSGKDASRAFVKGDFLNNLSEDVSDFTAEEFKGLVEWRDFYVESKVRSEIGRLVYSQEGQIACSPLGMITCWC